VRPPRGSPDPGPPISRNPGNTARAADSARTEEVDLALLDIHMPGRNGIDAAAEIAGSSPHVRIMMLTMFEDDASVFAALRVGARGYILKTAGREELLRAMRSAADGEAIFSPSIASRVLDYFGRTRPSVAPEEFPMLTGRERDVLHLLAQGRTNPAIGAALGLSAKTVSNYVSTVLSKLQVRDRAEAAEKVRGKG
jgi:DNA-binding NarL/FixJ family response regulator